MGAGSGFNQSAAPVNPGLNYLGTWNASTNTPTIVSGVGTNGDYYIVSVAGTTTIDGISDWGVGDWIIFNGTVWQKIDNSENATWTTGTATTTDFATTTTLQTIATTTNTVQFIEARIAYKKTAGAGTGTVGDGGAMIITVSAKNVAGTVTLGVIQNTYTGTPIDTETATFTVSGTNVRISVNGVLNDTISWSSLTLTNPII